MIRQLDGPSSLKCSCSIISNLDLTYSQNIRDFHLGSVGTSTCGPPHLLQLVFFIFRVVASDCLYFVVKIQRTAQIFNVDTGSAICLALLFIIYYLYLLRP